MGWDEYATTRALHLGVEFGKSKTMTSQEKAHKRTVAASRVEMTQMVLPQFANALGNVFGGQVVSWIDICAAVAAQRHCRAQVVTASIDAVHFLGPIKQGHIVVLRGQVNAVFNTSMECGVHVMSEDPLSGETHSAVKAYTTFVALDAYHRPRTVPEIHYETDEDHRRFTDAKERRSARLALRAARIARTKDTP